MFLRFDMSFHVTARSFHFELPQTSQNEMLLRTFAVVITLLACGAFGQSNEGTRCFFVALDANDYECRLVNQRIDSELDMQNIGGVHQPGRTNEHVTHVLSDNSSINIFPSLIIDNFPNLRIADFSNSSIAFFNRPITRCSFLRTLNINQNSISFIPGEIFKNCDQLAILRMSSNSISRIDTNAFNGLSRLVELSLTNNRIESLNLTTFAPLISILSMQVGRNYIEEITPQFFQQLPNMHTFFGDMNPLKTWVMASPGSPSHGLRSLSILGTQIATINAQTFVNFPALRFLWFGGLVELLPTLVNVEALEELRLDGNRLTRIVADSFINMPNLRRLSINSNLIHAVDFSNRSVNFLQNLQELTLDNNRIVSIPDGTFSMLNSLMLLGLTGNQIERLTENSIRPIHQLRALFLSHNRIHQIEREVFRGVNNLNFVAFDNFCFGLATTIRDFQDFETRVAASMEFCFRNSSVSTKINILVLILALAIVMKL